MFGSLRANSLTAVASEELGIRPGVRHRRSFCRLLQHHTGSIDLVYCMWLHTFDDAYSVREGLVLLIQDESTLRSVVI
jgi:hypothetical protein